MFVGLLPAPSSYLTDLPNVFVSVSGTNFYDQCFPSGFVNFGFCCMAAQWLRQKPCNLTKAILHCLSEVPDEIREFRKQAEKDWERFLLMRARELSKGKRKLLSAFICLCYVVKFLLTAMTLFHIIFFVLFIDPEPTA